MKKLGAPQRLVFLSYLDCKKRTKKDIQFPKESNEYTHDESLVRFMLENSSVTQQGNERSYHKVFDAIYLMCKQLCPGVWCTRSHCKKYGNHHAYNCLITRPSACKEYKAYIEKKKQREVNNDKK